MEAGGADTGFDYDWLVIGSGFGGSVSALRLAEKGYSVAVLECGRRFRDEDYAESAWNLRRYFWMPRIGLRGIFRLTVFKDVFIASGNGVGGGSLGYANTLYRARPAFFSDRQWDGLAEWEAELRPHYETAERMLGVVDYEGIGPADALLREYGEEIGVGETFKNTRVGVFFGPAGKEVDDPYLRRRGSEAQRLHALRQLHDRLPPRRQEHPRQELPLVRGEARRRGDPRAPGDRDPPARAPAMARTATRSRPSTPAPGSASAAAASGRGASSSPPARSAPTSCSRTASTRARSSASPTGSARSSAPTPSRSRRSPRPTTSATSRTRWRSPRASTPTPTPTSRSSPTGAAATRCRACSRR